MLETSSLCTGKVAIYSLGNRSNRLDTDFSRFTSCEASYIDDCLFLVSFFQFFFLLLIDKLRISMYHHTVEDQLDEINLISTIEKSIDFI